MACPNPFVLRKVAKLSHGMSFEHVRVHMIRYPKSELVQRWLGKLPQTFEWYFVLCASDSNGSRICCTSGRHLNEKQINRANKSISCSCICFGVCVCRIGLPIRMANLWTDAPVFIKRSYFLANAHCIFDIRLYYELTVNELNLCFKKTHKINAIAYSFHFTLCLRPDMLRQKICHRIHFELKRKDISVMSFCIQSKHPRIEKRQIRWIQRQLVHHIQEDSSNVKRLHSLIHKQIVIEHRSEQKEEFRNICLVAIHQITLSTEKKIADACCIFCCFSREIQYTCNDKIQYTVEACN